MQRSSLQRNSNLTFILRKRNECVFVYFLRRKVIVMYGTMDGTCYSLATSDCVIIFMRITCSGNKSNESFLQLSLLCLEYLLLLRSLLQNGVKFL